MVKFWLINNKLVIKYSSVLECSIQKNEGYEAVKKVYFNHGKWLLNYRGKINSTRIAQVFRLALFI
jgi:hypothetical protein